MNDGIVFSNGLLGIVIGGTAPEIWGSRVEQPRGGFNRSSCKNIFRSMFVRGCKTSSKI